jgi:CMP-N,N'-diacetyllegionaminic acid synthase
MKILCLIPARSGSKGIKDKNLATINGKSLLQWSIIHAQKSSYSKYIKIVVSTDSSKYQQIAINSGAECPFLRPKEISGDLSSDYEFTFHALEWLKENQNYVPDFVIHLRPTYPTRRVSDLDKCIQLFINHRIRYDSLRTIIPFEKSPFKMYITTNDTDVDLNTQEIIPLFQEISGVREPYNECRQKLPQAYLHNGCIDIFNTYCVYKHKSITGKKILGYIMSESEKHDIDKQADLEDIKNILNTNF